MKSLMTRTATWPSADLDGAVAKYRRCVDLDSDFFDGLARA